MKEVLGRVRYISEYVNEYFFFKELCEQFAVSRKTGYKWTRRYEEFGPTITINQ